MVPISTCREISSGVYLFGCKWCALGLLVALFGSCRSLLDGLLVSPISKMHFLDVALARLSSLLTNIFTGQDRHEEAKQIIVEYHANGDASHPIVELELTEMADSLKDAGMTTWKSIFDIRTLFNTRSRRYRLALCIAFSWFGQFSGNNIASYVSLLPHESLQIDSNTV